MTMMSILIATIPERAAMFSTLTDKVYSQAAYCQTVHAGFGAVQVVVDGERKFRDGGPSIGEKRQALMNNSTGKYVAYLDDDEDIAPNYVETLLQLCQQDADVCTFRSFIQLENFWGLVDMRLNNPNEQMTPDHIVMRSPWHVCAVKSEIAKRYRFDASNYGEDWQWFSQLLPDLKTEAHTDRIIHSYRHGPHSESDKALAFQNL